MNSLSFENLEFLHSEPAFPIRILSEWIYPQLQLEKKGITDTIVMFGSARIPSPEKFSSQNAGKQTNLTGQVDTTPIQKRKEKLIQTYQDAREIAKELTIWGQNLGIPEEPSRRLVICTGGGPGIMEAGNRGAKEAGGSSLAFNIDLPFEQEVNPYADPELSFQFYYFFMRKYWFVKHCRGLIAFPGGFGTLDEVFETLTLIQTRKRNKIPVVLYDSQFWNSLIRFSDLVDLGMIEEKDLSLFHFSDSPEDAVQFLRKNVQFSLTG
jgi:uncharacterized protein (TIGR00730 family)